MFQLLDQLTWRSHLALSASDVRTVEPNGNQFHQALARVAFQ